MNHYDRLLVVSAALHEATDPKSTEVHMKDDVDVPDRRRAYRRDSPTLSGLP